MTNDNCECESHKISSELIIAVLNGPAALQEKIDEILHYNVFQSDFFDGLIFAENALTKSAECLRKHMSLSSDTVLRARENLNDEPKEEIPF